MFGGIVPFKEQRDELLSHAVNLRAFAFMNNTDNAGVFNPVNFVLKMLVRVAEVVPAVVEKLAVGQANSKSENRRLLCTNATSKREFRKTRVPGALV